MRSVPRHILALGIVVLATAPAAAQSASPTPLSGPNTPVPSPICDIVNFGFCPQPAPPPPALPDLNAPATRVAALAPPAPMRHRHVRRRVPVRHD